MGSGARTPDSAGRDWPPKTMNALLTFDDSGPQMIDDCQFSIRERPNAFTANAWLSPSGEGPTARDVKNEDRSGDIDENKRRATKCIPKSRTFLSKRQQWRAQWAGFGRALGPILRRRDDPSARSRTPPRFGDHGLSAESTQNGPMIRRSGHPSG